MSGTHIMLVLSPQPSASVRQALYLCLQTLLKPSVLMLQTLLVVD